MEYFPSFSIFQTSLYKTRIICFFEELLELACNITWTYACFFVPYLFLTSADFLSIMRNWEAHFLKISIYYVQYPEFLHVMQVFVLTWSTSFLKSEVLDSSFKIFFCWASLVVQWLRIRLPLHGTQVRALIREDPTCHGTPKPACHTAKACTLHNY